MNELIGKIDQSEIEYHKVIIEQKKTADLIYSHWIMYLKRKYGIGLEGGITEGGEIVLTSDRELDS